jgi:hypothetical protein
MIIIINYSTTISLFIIIFTPIIIIDSTINKTFILRVTTFIYAKTILVVDMELGEKLFEDIGNLTKLNVKSVHPVEGVKMEVSFTSEIKALGKFPSGKNIGSAEQGLSSLEMLESCV